jgi:PKD repeat protein
MGRRRECRLARLWLMRRAGRVQSRAITSADIRVGQLSLFGWEDSMRSIPLLAATTVILMLATGCGDNGTGVNPPVANFNQVCTGLSCSFQDASAEGEGAITGWSWEFGDPNSGANTATVQNPTHVFSAAATYSVRLTVTDADGETNSITKDVAVTSGTTNQPPVAGFTVPTTCVAGADCLFTDTSTDDAPPLTGWSWNFGDPTSGTANTSTAQNPTHRFAVEGQYQVSLTVTDAQGATNAITQTVTIGPAAASQCTPVGTHDVDCALTLTQSSTVRFTLTARDCQLSSRVAIRPPFAESVFFNVCQVPVGEQVTLEDATGAPEVFPAGTVLVLRFTRGNPGPEGPEAGNPEANLTGTYPSWTIAVDDGGNIAAPRDFDDVVLLVEATVAP